MKERYLRWDHLRRKDEERVCVEVRGRDRRGPKSGVRELPGIGRMELLHSGMGVRSGMPPCCNREWSRRTGQGTRSNSLLIGEQGCELLGGRMTQNASGGGGCRERTASMKMVSRLVVDPGEKRRVFGRLSFFFLSLWGARIRSFSLAS